MAFGRLRRICNNVIKLEENKVLRAVLSIPSLQQDIIQLNTQDQLYDKGIDAKGISLGDYSPNTIYGTSEYEGKIQKGQRYDHITLSDSATFYATFRFKNTNNGFIISANDGNKELFKDFGDIVGLTPENLSVVRSWVRPLLVKEVRSRIFA